MAIDPDAIDRFLYADLPPVPQFKGMRESDLRYHIYTASAAALGQLKTEPRRYQLEGLASALWRRKSFLFLGMRMGKTKIALDWMTHLKRSKQAQRKGLVIAHAPIGLQVWSNEAAKHSDLDLRCINAGENEELIDALEGPCDGIVIPWSALQSMLSVKKLSRKEVPKLYPDHELLRLIAPYFSHAVIDETHLCQNHASLRFNIGADLLHSCEWRLGLTGTPFGRNPFAIWAQAFLIDEGATFGRSYYFFEQAFGQRQYNHFSKRKSEWVFAKALMSTFRSKLESISLAYELQEVQEVNVLSAAVELQMTPDQRKAYNEVVDKFIRLDPAQTVEVRATFVRLRQIASGYLPFTGPDGEGHVMQFKESPKLEWLKSFVEECPPDIQCIIFHEFTPSGRAICKALEAAKVSYAWLYGGESPSDKRAALEKFQKGKVQFLVANHATGGTSIDLPMADYLCFYESPVSPRTREQAAARPLARGSRVLVMDDLVCAPVEAKILGFIAEGRDITQALVHGDVRKGLRA